MQQKGQQTKNQAQLKPKNPFILKFSTEQRPRRTFSLNRLNYPENLQKDGTIIAKRDILQHELFEHHIVQNNMRIQGQLKKLQVAFIHDKVPQFYAYHFLNRLVTASEQKIEDKIIKQLQQIKAKRSYFHVISNSIKAREGCLKQLQRCLQNLFNNQQDNITKHVFREEIVHYRKLTRFVINHIRSWKSALNQISPEVDFTVYLYHGQDYLIKLLNDCEFIFNSFLTRFLKFSYRNDPYIMRPYIQAKQAKQTKFLQLFKFQDDEKNDFMIDLNYLAGQRAKFLQTKMNSRNQKIKQIEKIYHYRDIPLTSRIFVRKIPTPNDNKDNKDNNQQKIDAVVDNFMQGSDMQSQKKLKLAELDKKSEKMKKIKQIFGKGSQSSSKLINANMFETIQNSEIRNKYVSPYQEKLRFTQFQTKKGKHQNLNYQSDFQNLVRKKQLQVLKADNFEGSKTQRSFRNVKINDNLSNSRRFISKQQGLNQLQTILNQLDTFSPQKLQNFKLKKKQDPKSESLIKFNEGKMAKNRLMETQKTLLEHNQQVYVNVRNKVIEQIQKDFEQKQLFEQKKKQENQKIQELLQKKINQQSLKIIKDSRIKQLEGRQHLAKQMQSSQLFGYEQPQPRNSQKLTHLQEQLKKQMQLKWLRQVHQQLKRKTQLAQIQKIKTKQQKQLQKKLQKVRQKQETQKKFQQIERQQRAKAKKKQIELEEDRKRQLQQQMKQIIERQKESLVKFAATKKLETQSQLRQAMKAEMLQNLRKQNEKFYDDKKNQEEVRKKEKQYREHVRAKIQQEYNLGQQMKQNRQKQQQQAKIRLVKQKLGQFDTLSRKSGQKNMEKSQLQINVQKPQQLQKQKIGQLPDLRESIFPKYQKNSQIQKKKLRQQFEIQLFSFRKPETYEESKPQQAKTIFQPGKVPIKDFRTMIDQEMKQKQQVQKNKQIKLDEQNVNKLPNKQKNQQVQNVPDKKQQNIQIQRSQMGKTIKSQNSDKFTKFSTKIDNNKQNQINEQDQLTRMKLGMSFQEYQVYKKKKMALATKRDIQGQNYRKQIIEQKNAVVKIIDQFQKMDNLTMKNSGPQFLQNNQINQIPENLSVTMTENKKNKKGTQYQIKEQDLQNIEQNVKVDKGRKKIIHQQQHQQQQNQSNVKKSPNKKKKMIKDSQVLQANSRVTTQFQKRFITSESEQDEKNRRAQKKKRTLKNKKQKQQQQKQQKIRKQKQQNKQQNDVGPKISVVKHREIPVNSLSQFFTDHFQHMPKVLKKINIYKKQQLIKYLLEHASFTILQVIKESVSIGLGIVIYNENKTKYRSLNIVHLGAYDEADYLQLLLGVVRHCFKNDPCEEIAMSNVYDKDIPQQWDFIKNFQRIFDPYGAIFQKKIFNTEFERKFVLRRNIGEICKIQPQNQFNLGMVQLTINSIIIQSSNKILASNITQSDSYSQMGFNSGYYGLIAHFISERYSEQALAYLIAKSTSKQSNMTEKIVASLAKLALAMKKNKSFQRLNQLHQQKFNDVMSLNLQLLAKNEIVLPYPPEQIQSELQCSWYNYKVSIQLAYSFYTQTIPIKISQNSNDQPEEYECKYFRYNPTNSSKNKIFTLKSSAYSSKITVLPCKDNKYKIFVMDQEEYRGLLQKSYQTQNDSRIDLGIYLRVFFANISQHEVANYDHVWLPELKLKMQKFQMTNIQQFSKAEKQAQSLNIQNQKQSSQMFISGILRSQLNHKFCNYLGPSLKISPSHRDLLVTPPYIMGVINMQIQTALEGSPVYVQRVGKQNLAFVKRIQKIVKDSD